MFGRKGDQIIRASYSQRVLMDVLEAARRPDSYAVMLLDMSAAEAFRRDYKEKYGIALTSLHLLIKTLALTIEHDPWVHYLVDGYKIVKPATIDIGVSVAADESVTPVVVIEQANKKPLRVIAEEMAKKAEEAIMNERRMMDKLNRIGRWIPLDFLRRWIIKWTARRYQLRRAFIGTAQVTSLGFRYLDFHLPSHMGTTILMSVGGIRKRPVVVGNNIEIRPTVFIAFQVDTRILNAKKALMAFRRFRRWIEQPQELDKVSGA